MSTLHHNTSNRAISPQHIPNLNLLNATLNISQTLTCLSSTNTHTISTPISYTLDISHLHLTLHIPSYIINLLHTSISTSPKLLHNFHASQLHPKYLSHIFLLHNTTSPLAYNLSIYISWLISHNSITSPSPPFTFLYTPSTPFTFLHLPLPPSPSFTSLHPSSPPFMLTSVSTPTSQPIPTLTTIPIPTLPPILPLNPTPTPISIHTSTFFPLHPNTYFNTLLPPSLHLVPPTTTPTPTPISIPTSTLFPPPPQHLLQHLIAPTSTPSSPYPNIYPNTYLHTYLNTFSPSTPTPTSTPYCPHLYT